MGFDCLGTGEGRGTADVDEDPWAALRAFFLRVPDVADDFWPLTIVHDGALSTYDVVRMERAELLASQLSELVAVLGPLPIDCCPQRRPA